MEFQTRKKLVKVCEARLFLSRSRVLFIFKALEVTMEMVTIEHISFMAALVHGSREKFFTEL